jgi:hypothetical protein
MPFFVKRFVKRHRRTRGGLVRWNQIRALLLGSLRTASFSRSGDPMRRKFHDWMVGSDPYVLGLAGDAVLAVLTAGVITGSIRLIVGFL